MNKAAVKLI
ncbi:hypothetical protein D043_1580A, partial [Vibrio parahaemolyticus EKP-021]